MTEQKGILKCKNNETKYAFTSISGTYKELHYKNANNCLL